MPDFNIRVKIDPANAEAGAKRVGGSLDKVESKAKQLQTVLLRTFAVIGISAGITQGVRLVADFGQTMSTVQAITNATGEEFERLSDRAKDLGDSTRFSASDAAEGLLLIARAGFDVSQSIDTVDDTLNLALAGALGLGEAAQITTQTLSGFRLETSQAGRVVDVLAAAANAANTDVSQLGQAVKFVGPVAAGVGVELETTVAAISALSDAGLQATMAGTGLRRVISELESPSNKTREILEKVGLTTNDVIVSQVGLVKALQNLKSAGVDTGLALEIFGDRGGPAFEVLGSSIPKLIEMEKRLNTAEGTADRIAKTMDDNLNGALLNVESGFEAILIELGDLGKDRAQEFLLDLADALRLVAANVDVLVKGIQALVIVLSVAFAQRALNAVNAQLIKFFAIIAANPIGALSIALAAVIVALAAFRDQISLTEDGMISLGDFGSATIQLLTEGLNNLFAVSETGFPAMTTDAETASKATGAGFLAALATIAQVLDTVIALVFGLIDAFVFGVTRIPVAFKDSIVTAVNFWIETFQKGINTLISIANKAGALIGAPPIPTIDFETLENDARGGLADLGRTVKEAFTNQLDLTTPFSNALDSAFDKAAEISAKRRFEEERAARDAVALPGGIPTAPSELEEVELRSGVTEFQQILNNLRQEQELLKLSSKEYGIRSEVLQLQTDLTEKLTEAQKAQLTEEVRATQALRDQAAVFDEIRGPQNALIEKQQILHQLFTAGRITADEYAKALDSVKVQLAELTGHDLSFFDKLRMSLEQGPTATDALVGGFESATDAIADFVATGTADIDRFFQNLLAQLTKILANQALLGILRSLGGGPTTATVAPFIGIPGVGGFATGGSFTVGGSGGADSQPVAFMATPGERVNVETPGQQASQQAQPRPIYIINVTDPKEITQVMSEAEGSQVIINTITRNKTRVRQAIS